MELNNFDSVQHQILRAARPLLQYVAAEVAREIKASMPEQSPLLPPGQKRYVSMQEAADFFGISVSFVYSRVSLGLITPLYFGTRKVIDLEQLVALAKKPPEGTQPPPRPDGRHLEMVKHTRPGRPRKNAHNVEDR